MQRVCDSRQQTPTLFIDGSFPHLSSSPTLLDGNYAQLPSSAIYKYPFNKTLPHRNKHLSFLWFAEWFSSPSLRSGEGFREGIFLCESFPHQTPKACPFWKTAETSKKIRLFRPSFFGHKKRPSLTSFPLSSLCALGVCAKPPFGMAVNSLLLSCLISPGSRSYTRNRPLDKSSIRRKPARPMIRLHSNPPARLSSRTISRCSRHIDKVQS